jgi:hypothetical protein
MARGELERTTASTEAGQFSLGERRVMSVDDARLWATVRGPSARSCRSSVWFGGLDRALVRADRGRAGRGGAAGGVGRWRGAGPRRARHARRGSSTAHTSDRQLRSPGRRPITSTLRRVSPKVRSIRLEWPSGHPPGRLFPLTGCSGPAATPSPNSCATCCQSGGCGPTLGLSGRGRRSATTSRRRADPTKRHGGCCRCCHRGRVP